MKQYSDSWWALSKKQLVAAFVLFALIASVTVILTGINYFTSRASDDMPVQAHYRVDINNASIDEIAQLPEIGPARAKAIVSYRDKNGGFKDINDIQNVKGIGPYICKAIEKYIFIETQE